MSAPEAYETLYEEYVDHDPGAVQDDRNYSQSGQHDDPFDSESRFDPEPEPDFAFADDLPTFSAGPNFDEPDRRRGSWFVSALVGLFGTAAVLGVLIAGAWYFRPQIVSLAPKTQALYALLPVKQPASEYELLNTGYIEATEEGRQVLIVSGEVVNKSGKPIAVPVVQVTVRTISGRDLDQWKFKPRGNDIAPGEARYFETRRLNPPEGAQRLHLIIIEED